MGKPVSEGTLVEGFVEVGSYQKCKSGRRVAGDTFLSRRSRTGDRTVTVLSDGLGSGIKASVLSTLTATMALRLTESTVSIDRVGRLIMDILPVCGTRRISYSTFTIVDISSGGNTRIIEYDNPRCFYMRNGREVVQPRHRIELDRPEGGTARLFFSEYAARREDRIVFCSDGVTQAGMGTAALPLGWSEEGVRSTVGRLLHEDPTVSASALARRLVQEALRRDGFAAHDDISSAVIYFRRPRRLLLVSGPPLDPARDGLLAERLLSFEGRKIIAGGTTGNIVARELGVKPRLMMSDLDREIPPYARMEGVDLVTEGIITMARVAELLECTEERRPAVSNAATLAVEHLLESDSIDFLIGTRVNQAHQDPSVPARFELRRTILTRIATILSEKYLKEISISFV